MTEEQVQVRVYGDASLPTLIYLPGLHGDWTLIGSFRQQVLGKVRFVEMTYPRTFTWSLEDYAKAIESALAQHGISRGWLLGESFGSQPLWELVKRQNVQVDGVILAGGFVKHTMRWAVRLAEKIAGRLSLRVITWLIFTYGKLAHFRYRHSPETMATLKEFAARRTVEDVRAAQHRLHLIAENNACATASVVKVPVYAMTGFIDPIVPWPFVRRWLRKNCATLKDYKIIPGADHAVLATAPRPAAAQVLQWIESSTAHGG